MREIKFRAWDGKQMIYLSNKWWCDEYASLCFCNEEDEELGDICGFSIKEFNTDDEPILMQYTGIRDKTGKEIYEGDIVKYWGGTAPIVYYESGFYIKYTGEDYYSIQYESSSLQVIGNIYDNPELIELCEH